MQQRLYDKNTILHYLGDISPETYDRWFRLGNVPGPVPNTRLYDRRAHDQYLDRVQGLANMKVSTASEPTPLEAWSRDASQA
jgi:hypothetical protein